MMSATLRSAPARVLSRTLSALLSRGELILVDHLPTRVREAAPPRAAAEAEETPRLDQLERNAILHELQVHQFNRTETAKALGISRRALVYKLQRLREAGFNAEAAALAYHALIELTIGSAAIDSTMATSPSCIAGM